MVKYLIMFLIVFPLLANAEYDYEIGDVHYDTETGEYGIVVDISEDKIQIMYDKELYQKYKRQIEKENQQIEKEIQKNYLRLREREIQALETIAESLSN